MVQDPLIGARLGGYRIEALVGRGGMGVVYRAEQVRLRRRVALKLILPELAADRTFRERFVRESQLAASLDHPNVIPVHEAGESDGRLFIVMRYVDGVDLRSLILAEGPLEPGRAARVIGSVGAALDAAHALGLVHRDVKPANILLTRAHGDEHAYLSDFGLTKLIGAQGGPTRSGLMVGTVDYAAPEQIRSGDVDARTDVYALGCVLFDALTGSPPFRRTSEAATLWAHMNDPPPSPRRSAPQVPPAFDAVVSRAMAKAPDDRFPSAGDLGRAALAAAEGTAAPAPERSVATGDAAAGAAAAAAGTAAWPAEGATAAQPTAERATPPGGTAVRPEGGRAQPDGPPAWSGPTPPARRRRWPIAVAVAVLALVLAGTATALVASGTFDDSPDTVSDGGGNGGGGDPSPPAPDPPPQPQPQPPASPPPAQPPAQPPPPASGTREFNGVQFTASYPTNWSLVQAEAASGEGGVIRHTEFAGPTGEKVIVEYIPNESMSPREKLAEVQASAGVETVSERDVTLGGRPAVEWVFVGDPGDRQVDYFLNVDGQAYAVLGSGEDFEKTRRVAEQVAASIATA